MRSVGFICDVRVNSNPSHVAGASRLQRAVPMAAALEDAGLDLFAYARQHVNPRTGLAFGYCVRENRFVPDARPVPRVNGFWAFNNVPAPDINGLGHRRFLQWCGDNGIAVYPPYEFLKLTLDKFATYELVSAFDPALHPHTDHWQHTTQQLDRFLDEGPTAFLKPRFGSQGEGVIVVRRGAGGLELKIYQDAKTTTERAGSSAKLMARIDTLLGDRRFVIQRGVDVKRHEGAAFIIRAVMVSDGRDWHCAPKLVMTPGEGDVANTSQGGRNFTVEEQLPVIFGPRIAEQAIASLRKTSLELAAHLDSLYGQEIMEVAFDFVLDVEGKVFLGEMDVQPGLVRPGMNPHEPFKNIFDVQPDERGPYDRFVLPHARCLARFLQSKLEAAQAPSKAVAVRSTSGTPEHIGFLCNVNTAGSPTSTLKPSVLDRAILIDEGLRGTGQRLFLYSPKYVACDAFEIPGYVIDQRRFIATSAPVPRVNANFTAVSRQLLRKGMGYRSFLSWTRRNGIEIYTPYAFSDLVRNKHRTSRLVASYDTELHPYTEPCDHTAAQLEAFVERSPLVFLKPTSGNKGDGVIVLSRTASGFALAHHASGERESLQAATLDDVANMTAALAGKTRYVIQHGIDTLPLNGAAFDVRVIMVNDGTQWHWLHETRVGAAGSALSNIHQGGASLATETALEPLLGMQECERVMRALHDVSCGLAAFLDERFEGGLMEMAFDFMLDREHRIHLAEINTKPGLAGIDPETTVLDQRCDQSPGYERYVVPHVTWLTSFLRSKAERRRCAA